MRTGRSPCRSAVWIDAGGTGNGAVTRARLLWHVTANEVSPTVHGHDRLDTRQDTPPDALRV
jgi:hypothetical protein